VQDDIQFTPDGISHRGRFQEWSCRQGLINKFSHGYGLIAMAGQDFGQVQFLETLEAGSAFGGIDQVLLAGPGLACALEPVPK